MKRFLYFICILFTCNVQVEATVLEETDGIEDDDMFKDWTDEQYEEYEDSILANLYPPVTVQETDTTLLGQIVNTDTSSQRYPVSGYNVPNAVDLDKSKEVGQIVIKRILTYRRTDLWNTYRIISGHEKFSTQFVIGI